MKAKIKLPVGFKYLLDRESCVPTPIVRCNIDNIIQDFYLPVKNDGTVLPLMFNLQQTIDKIEINFSYTYYNNVLVFDCIVVVDRDTGIPGHTHRAEFKSSALTAEEFEAGTNHFSKPKRLTHKTLCRLHNAIKFLPMPDVRQVYFYLLKKQQAIVNARILSLTDEFMADMSIPQTTQESLASVWDELDPQKMRDGTIQ